MQTDDDLVQWLEHQPLDEPVEIGGEYVYLKVGQGGAELGAFLIQSFSQVQMLDVLKLGFRSAMEFDAALSQSADGRSLLLAQWLPDVYGWSEAVEPLENLLHQVEMWRAALATKPARTDALRDKAEQRVRGRFEGVNP